jgi:hypothetical protein
MPHGRRRNMTKKVEVELPDDVYAALRELGVDAKDPNLAVTLARAITTTKYLKDRKSDGARVLVEENGALEEVHIR